MQLVYQAKTMEFFYHKSIASAAARTCYSSHSTYRLLLGLLQYESPITKKSDVGFGNAKIACLILAADPLALHVYQCSGSLITAFIVSRHTRSMFTKVTVEKLHRYV